MTEERSNGQMLPPDKLGGSPCLFSEQGSVPLCTMCAEKRSVKMKRTIRRSVVGLVVAVFAAATGAQELVLAERGKPADRVIVIAKDAGPSLKYAAEELQRYVKELTGVELVVSADAQERVPPAWGAAILAAHATRLPPGSECGRMVP